MTTEPLLDDGGIVPLPASSVQIVVYSLQQVTDIRKRKGHDGRPPETATGLLKLNALRREGNESETGTRLNGLNSQKRGAGSSIPFRRFVNEIKGAGTESRDAWFLCLECLAHLDRTRDRVTCARTTLGDRKRLTCGPAKPVSSAGKLRSQGKGFYFYTHLKVLG